MDEILNTSNLGNIRFRMSKPQGYFTEDVEKFIDGAVRESLTVYQEEITNARKNVKSMEERIAQLNNRIAELEIKENFDAAAGNIEQDEALVASLQKQEAMEDEITSLKTKVNAFDAELKAKDSHIDELNKYIDEVQPILEQGAAAIEELERLRSEPQAVVAEPVVEEDLTSYDSDEDAEITQRNKISKKTTKSEEDFSNVHEIATDNIMEFDMSPEVDEDLLNEELANIKEEEFDPNEFEKLPDGTIVPKGIRPEDL